MALTYDSLATTTLSTNQANVTFSSISSAYTDLVLVMQVKAGTTSGVFLQLQLNGDSGTNYSRTGLIGNGATASSGRASNDTWIYTSQIANLGTTYYDITEVNLLNYSNTTTNKTVISRSSYVDNNTQATVSLWRSTAAINQILIQLSSGNLASGSTFTLYGIKAA